jgi:CDGSH-type Zn-finger protein
MNVRIDIVKNGPLKVEGAFTVHKADGSVAPHTGEVAHLCRCGQSSTKPYCDGAHKKAEFKAD